jgi:hypothetical protein
MAKHLREGKEFPVFFYGQHYGFAPVETVPGAVAYRLFGASAIALKLAMLAVWTAGVVFLFLALSRFVGAGRSFWVATLLLLNPAWAAAVLLPGLKRGREPSSRACGKALVLKAGSLEPAA